MSHDEPTAVLTTRPAPPGATADARPAAPRSLAPDLARGMLLLFIASANVWGYLWAADGAFNPVSYRPVGGSTLDHVVDGLVTFFVDNRSRPMFAILYGFGIATMATRLAARGADRRGVRRVLARRSGWLVAFGFLHAVLLFGGDILAAYGITGLITLALLHRSQKVLVRWFWGSSVLATAVGVVLLLVVVQSEGEMTATPTSDYLASALQRAALSVFSMSASALALFFVPQVILGILLARAGWLTRPWDHRQALGRVFLGAAAVNLVLNLPYALATARVWTPDRTTATVLEVVHYLSGVVMGLGYVCLFAWVAAVLRDRPRRGVVSAVAAVGERSLTSYLLQSVMFAPLLSAWGLGLGGRIGTAQAAVLAVAVWLVTVVIAVAMHRAGRRGPFEVLLRRLTYGRGGSAVTVPVRAPADLPPGGPAAPPVTAGVGDSGTSPAPATRPAGHDGPATPRG
ncbi:DUF418 domain-containing protein [Cellulomonas sp. 179-A 4D5 NHS]|uniref:DUF418 domain-containing protein n=1 Tax=Cellulomonas sp. 179-A 4D5 NHS TaxID=3142378 RepID=UPI00399FFF9B